MRSNQRRCGDDVRVTSTWAFPSSRPVIDSGRRDGYKLSLHIENAVFNAAISIERRRICPVPTVELVLSTPVIVDVLSLRRRHRASRRHSQAAALSMAVQMLRMYRPVRTQTTTCPAKCMKANFIFPVDIFISELTTNNYWQISLICLWSAGL